MIVTGRLEQRSWETPDGDKRSKVEVVADEIGPSIRWATAQVTKNERRGPAAVTGRTGAAAVSGGQSSGGGAPADSADTDTARSPSRWPGTTIVEAAPRRRAPKDTGRRVKKKPCALCKDRVEWVDYKDVAMLRKYMSDRGKIRARRVSGNCTQHQRDVAIAIKTARELVLLPYTQRTTTERPAAGVAVAVVTAGSAAAAAARARRGADAGRGAAHRRPSPTAPPPRPPTVEVVEVEVVELDRRSRSSWSVTEGDGLRMWHEGPAPH